VAPDAWSKSRTIANWTLRIVLGVVFLYIGTTKLTGTGNTVEYFAAIGWGQWFRYLTGVLDVGGVVLLFVPKWTCFGASVIACSVGLGTLISLTVLRDDPTWGSSAMVAVPLALTLLAVLLAWLTRPHRAN
jgi:putative oxidoreductase